MKKVLLSLLALCMLLSCFACQTGGDGDKETSGGGNKEPIPEGVVGYTAHSYDKVIANVENDNLNNGTDYTLYMMKGETESVQLVIYSKVDVRKTHMELVSGANDNITVNMFTMDRTHTIKRREWTDALIPYYGRTLRLPANKNFPFFVDFKTTKDTPAGDYKYTFSFVDEATDVLLTYNITVHVWDITLPEEKTFATSVGISTYHVNRFFSNGGTEMYIKFYEMLLENNMSAYDLPYDILDERADAYMSDPRVTSFIVPCKGLTDEEIVEYYEKIKSNPDWLKKALFYPIDEPREMDHLEEYEDWCVKLKALAPEIPVIAPFYTNIKTDTRKDQVDHMASHTDLWCPKLCLWDDDRSYGDYGIDWQTKSFAERMKEMQESGDRMWSYVCNDPIDPYAQLFADTQGLIQRLMMWQHYQRDIEGFLYWGATAWGYTGNEGIDPWDTLANGVKDGEGTPVYGEGLLFYPGTKVGVGGPVASVRQKYVRDGIDDIEMFYLAETVLGKEWVMGKVNYATPDLKTYISEEEFAALRIEIGNALEAALNK